MITQNPESHYSHEYDAVLIQPPLFTSFSDYNESRHIEKEYWRTMQKYAGRLLGDLPLEASYGILSIGSYLKKHGFKIKIIDFHLMDYFLRQEQHRGIKQSDIIETLSQYRSVFFGLSVLTISEKWSNIITNITTDLYAGSCIFWGGYFATKNDIKILKKNNNINFIVRHEGEIFC